MIVPGRGSTLPLVLFLLSSCAGVPIVAGAATHPRDYPEPLEWVRFAFEVSAADTGEVLGEPRSTTTAGMPTCVTTPRAAADAIWAELRGTPGARVVAYGRAFWKNPGLPSSDCRAVGRTYEQPLVGATVIDMPWLEGSPVRAKLTVQRLDGPDVAASGE